MAKDSKKIDRNRKWCEAYRLREQREMNKALKLARHIRRAPWDDAARKAFEAIPVTLRKRAHAGELPPRTRSPREEREAVGLTLTRARQPRPAVTAAA